MKIKMEGSGRKMTFNQFLRKKRIDARLSQHFVAEWLGYNGKSTIANKEKGVRAWSLEDMISFADMLGLYPDELLKEWRILRNC